MVGHRSSRPVSCDILSARRPRNRGQSSPDSAKRRVQLTKPIKQKQARPVESRCRERWNFTASGCPDEPFSARLCGRPCSGNPKAEKRLPHSGTFAMASRNPKSETIPNSETRTVALAYPSQSRPGGATSGFGLRISTFGFRISSFHSRRQASAAPCRLSPEQVFNHHLIKRLIVLIGGELPGGLLVE